MPPEPSRWRRRWQRVRHLSAAQWRVVAQALVLVPIVRWWLRRDGFDRTASRLADRSSGFVVAAPPPPPPAELVDAVALVAGRSVIGARCLGRSLVAWFLLRRRGVDAVLEIGARLPVVAGLDAHAWVEVDGVPIGEAADVREQFGSFGVRLPRLRVGPVR